MPNKLINIQQVDPAQVIYYDGPNGTGNAVMPKQATTWDTSDHAKLTAVSTGFETAHVTGVAVGTNITLTAVDPTTGTTASKLFDVADPIVSGVVTLVKSSLNVNEVVAASVVWKGIAGNTISASSPSVWTSSNTNDLTVVSTGSQAANMTGQAAGGGLHIMATDAITGTIAFSITINVADPIVSGVATPAATAINAGQVVGVSVVWKGAKGNVITPVATTTWASSNAGVLSVASNGLQSANMTGVAAGSGVMITATDPASGTTATTAPISVANPIVSGVATRTLSPINVLQTSTASVVWKDANGNAVTPGVTTTWSSSNPSLVSVASSGLQSATYTGQAAGSFVTLLATDPTTGVQATTPTIVVNDPIATGTITVAAGTTLTAGNTYPATVAWFGAKGNAKTPVATSVWASSNTSDLTVASTGLQSATITAVAAGVGINLTATDPTSNVVATLAMVVVAGATNANGAQFITSSITSVSSLDTGRLGYIVGWGGNEFGYAYTYALDGTQPAGVTIDADTGVLSAGSPIAAGSHTFGVIVTNRETPANANTWPFTLIVLTGVTSGRTGTQVLHKTYDPHSGTYGTVPSSGGDWTTILLAIQSAIQADQVTNGEEQLRAVIPFHKGVTYNYTNNHWLTGLQYYDVTATGSGANPILCNNGSGTVYEGGPLNIGQGGAVNSGNLKGVSALINTVAAGSTTVTCSTPAQVSRLIPGRWHGVMGSCIQLGGFPPNVMFMDYVRVLAVNASTGVVTLDRPLKYGYDSTWWENAGDADSVGRAWILPWDTGGSGGTIPSDARITMRGRWSNITFAANPGSDHSKISLVQAHIQCDFDTCTITNPQLTMTKHFALYNSATTGGTEPDKMSETLVMDGGTSDGIGPASGFQYVLFRNAAVTNDGAAPNTAQMSPRQVRSIGSTFNALASSTPPYNFSFNGPNWYLDFETTTFTGTAVGNTWTYDGGAYSPLTIGSGGVVWSGNQLRIPSSVANFENWLINSYAGSIIALSGLGPITTNWGYINSVTSDGAGTALWLNVVWVNGAKPTSGTIDIVAGRFRRLKMTSPTFGGSMGYANAKMAKQTVTGQTSWNFPAGYPAQYAT